MQDPGSPDVEDEAGAEVEVEDPCLLDGNPIFYRNISGSVQDSIFLLLHLPQSWL